MNLKNLKTEVSKYMHLEDTGVLDVIIASIMSNRMRLDGKIWLAIVGESSGGKSQIINPVLKSDENYFIKVDDISENAFLSAAIGKQDNSLLTPDKTNNTLVFSDLTVLFSKNAEIRNAVLSQFRMIFDGSMTKLTGNGKKEWRGRMGVLAGCTPSIYRHLAEVADMGERFMYYRLKSNDPVKATELVLNRLLSGNALDDTLSNTFGDYMEGLGKWIAENKDSIAITEDIKQYILQISMFAEKVRTSVPIDKYTKLIERIPVSAMPMRTALQLKSLATGLVAMNMYERELNDATGDVVDVKKHLDWVAYSMADEETRKMLEIFSGLEWRNNQTITTQQIGDYIGLSTSVAGLMVSKLTAIGIVERISGNGAHRYKIKEEASYKIIKRVVNKESIDIPEEDPDYKDE